jgi:DNA-binding protein H-NS
MKTHDLESMSVDELWDLHLDVTAVLTRTISAKKRKLEQRLQQLQLRVASNGVQRERRPYPRVFPKYRNPDNPSETWTGRGKQPRWLTGQLRTGRHLDDFRIQPPIDRTRRRAARR